jgi:RNA-directed DNA polymerase
LASSGGGRTRRSSTGTKHSKAAAYCALLLRVASWLARINNSFGLLSRRGIGASLLRQLVAGCWPDYQRRAVEAVAVARLEPLPLYPEPEFKGKFCKIVGGVLSPLLSNIVLDELDQELARRGLRFVRYADDANIFVRSERAGTRVMSSLRRFLERRLRLQINDGKSAVRRPEQVHFLGFRFCCTEDVSPSVGVVLSAKAKRAVMATIRDMTPPNWGRSITSCMADLSRYLNGWMAHYRLCTAEAAPEFGTIDAHIRRRIRAIIVRQKKRPRFLFRHLLSRKVSRKAAAGTAYCGKGSWVKSNRPGMTAAYPPAWFRGRVLAFKARWHELTPPRVTDQLLLAI